MEKYNNIPLDGKPLSKEQALVPFWIQNGYQLSEAEKKRTVTWKIGGQKFLIGFIAIPAKNLAIYKAFFTKELNTFLAEHREGRCIVGYNSSTGLPVLCSKTNRCSDCDEKGLHTRYNPRTSIKVLSLDYQMENGFDYPNCNSDNPLEYLIHQEEATVDNLYTQLIRHFRKTNPRYAAIIELKMRNIPEKEIFDRIGLKHSRGYQEISSAYEAAKKFLESIK